MGFDCFTFPSHIGNKARLGPPASDQQNSSALALDMRRRFKLNVAGVLRRGSEEPEWFPGPSTEVSGGDLGLVVRKPCRDGSTQSTVLDEDLKPLLDKHLFTKLLKDPQDNSLQRIHGLDASPQQLSQCLEGE